MKLISSIEGAFIAPPGILSIHCLGFCKSPVPVAAGFPPRRIAEVIASICKALKTKNHAN
jgi:hypothetical protein